jgi:fluoroquinolone resistance protein
MIDLEAAYHESEAIHGLDLSNHGIPGREFYRCAFEACNLTEADLSSCVFEDCVFRECNLSNPLIKGVKLISAEFLGCKLAGINFYYCDQLLFDSCFSGTHLQNCNFSELKMKGARFIGCRIDECDFENAFLVEARFDDSVFSRTMFHNCNLEKASFLEAKGYQIDPRSNNVKKATFSVPDVLSLIECFGVSIKNRE